MSHPSEPYTELESILEEALRNDDMSQAERWRKPRTTRRYLQGPLAERLLVMFREGKILYGDVHHLDDWSFRYRHVRSHAVWLVGQNDEPFDFKKAELNVIRSLVGMIQ